MYNIAFLYYGNLLKLSRLNFRFTEVLARFHSINFTIFRQGNKAVLRHFRPAEPRVARFPLEKQFTGLFFSAECCLPLAKQFTGLFRSAECHSKGSFA